MKTFTNIEQTERLRKLGLFPTTYNEHYDGTWTLGDLLDLMPKEIESAVVVGNQRKTFKENLQISYKDGCWRISYDFDDDEYIENESLIEALVLAIELLAANGYNFKKKKK